MEISHYLGYFSIDFVYEDRAGLNGSVVLNRDVFLIGIASSVITLEGRRSEKSG